MYEKNKTSAIDRFIFYCMKKVCLFIKNRNNRQYYPRYWANDELRSVANCFDGHVINISAGNDKDKEGKEYKDYFSNAKSYSISNLKKITGIDTEIELDLDIPLMDNLDFDLMFDVVMNNTVLEHVYNVTQAVENLCFLSRDIVITIVPFIQTFHHSEKEYSDYWRFSPFCIRRLFEECAFHTIYMSWNNDALGDIYLFHIATKNPDKWVDTINGGWFNGIKGPGYYRNMLINNSTYCKDVIINKVH